MWTRDKFKLASSEIGTLWGEYVNGTMTRYGK